jgi:hypothetical protein
LVDLDKFKSLEIEIKEPQEACDLEFNQPLTKLAATREVALQTGVRLIEKECQSSLKMADLVVDKGKKRAMEEQLAEVV